MRAFVQILFLSLISTNLYAQVIQILHTNDLHSYLDRYDEEDHIGGYARVKTLIDKYKQKASEQGIKTLVVDAGDDLEGNIYYMADYGRKSLKLLDHMGYDVVTIGNHDWLMGAEDQEKMIADVDPSFNYLGANFWANADKYPVINKVLKPYVIYNIDGIRLAFLGLVTSSKMYSWRIGEGGIRNELGVGVKYADLLKNGKNVDYVVALTHIGLKKDIKLAKHGRGMIDMVIGGHSHTELFKPIYVNQRLKKVPVVQSGSHGKYLGRTLLEIKKNKPLKVLEYELIPTEGVKKDEHIVNIVKEADEDLNKLYGKEWLNEIIGYSEIPLKKRTFTATTWDHFITDALREAVDTDVAVNVSALGGHDLRPGPITRKHLFNAYPRIFEFDRPLGWKVYKAKVHGIVVKILAEVLAMTDAPLYVSGMSFNIEEGIFGRKKATNVMIAGEKLKYFKKYTVAMPEGIIRGGYAISKYVRKIIMKGESTSELIWKAIEDKMDREKVIKSDYLYTSSKKFKKKSKGKPLHRAFVPGKEHRTCD